MVTEQTAAQLGKSQEALWHGLLDILLNEKQMKSGLLTEGQCGSVHKGADQAPSPDFCSIACRALWEASGFLYR